MGISRSDETDAIAAEPEVEADGLRVSGERLRAGEAPKPESFDDVTPTRSLADVGLADMDEDLPTRMQTLDELARLSAETISQTQPTRAAILLPESDVSIDDWAPATTPRRDVLRPPAVSDASTSSDGFAFRSFPPPGRSSSAPPPRGDATAPAVPRAASVPREAARFADRAPSSASEPPAAPRVPRVMLAISGVLLVAAVVALVLEQLGR